MNVKIKLPLLLILLFSACLFIIHGCRPQMRYELLTFFFDGVPPLTSPDANQISDARQTSEQVKGAVAVPAESGSSRHQPAKDCNKCHEEGSRYNRKQLHQPLQLLCYRCHTNFGMALDAHIHGPVAVGACLSCHNPHQSDEPKLLTAKDPQLCYQCHVGTDIIEIPVHRDNQSAKCTKCHDPHLSGNKFLLRPNYDKETVPGIIE